MSIIRISPDYNKLISEHFDLTDRETRKSVIYINEQDQNKILVNLTSKLYDHVVNKVDNIDFGDIPKTKGDIEALPEFSKLQDAVATIEGLLVQYKQDTKYADIIKNAIANMISLKDTFKAGYAANVEMPIVIYNTIVLSIISATSFLISSCVEYIKIPNSDEFQITINKIAYAKSKENLLLENLDKFNASCSSGQMKKAMDHVIKGSSKESFVGVDALLLANIVIITGLALSIIPMMRELIYFFYFSRVKISDYFDVQSELLQANALNVQNNSTLSSKQKTDTIKQQKSIADFFKKISDVFAVKMSTSTTKTNNEVKADQKQYKIGEVVDHLPDKQTSSLF